MKCRCGQDARQSIIDAVKALLDEVEDIEEITTRRIAEKAGVGTGLINYHFKSKDNLLSVAVGGIMSDIISQFIEANAYAGLNPIERLKVLVKELCTLIDCNEKLTHFVLSREITDMQIPMQLIPLLKEIYGAQKDDMQLRIIALQIVRPIQTAGLDKSAFHIFSGIDLRDAEQRSRFVDALIDNLITA